MVYNFPMVQIRIWALDPTLDQSRGLGVGTDSRMGYSRTNSESYIFSRVAEIRGLGLSSNPAPHQPNQAPGSRRGGEFTRTGPGREQMLCPALQPESHPEWAKPDFSPSGAKRIFCFVLFLGMVKDILPSLEYIQSVC